MPSIKQQFLFLVVMLFLISNQALAVAQSQEETQKTVYIYRPLINGHDLQNWAHEQGLKILSEDVLHVTLAYSQGGIENLAEMIEDDPSVFYNSDPDQLRQLEFFGKENSILVLKLNAPELVARWEELTAAGAQWTWPAFEPHVTLTYEAKGIDLNQITPYYGDLIFGPEVYVEKD